MAINVTTSKQQITASVAEDKISATVSGGFGATGPSGVINVTAPITNAGTTTAANVGLSVGTGLSVSGGSLVVTPDTYATLVGGKVPADQLPSYVDDVLEYANLASLPATGESGKIYVALNTGKIYRWSGSAYFEISTQPGNTDAVPEGSSNLYFTNARARSSFGTGASGQVVRWDGSEWSAGAVPIASASIVGGVRIGSGISIDGSGIISASSAYTLPTATASVLGGVKIGSGVTITDGAISVSTDYAAASHASTHAPGGADELFDQSLNTDDSPTFAGLTIVTGEGTVFLTEEGGGVVFGNTATFNGFTDFSSATIAGLSYNSLDGLPTLFDGSYTSLTSVPSTFTPSAHNQAWSTITSTPTTLSGYGITDAVASNDARLTDARTPTSHAHGNITNAGAIGSTANLPVITTTSGVLTTGTFGTSSGQFAAGDHTHAQLHDRSHAITSSSDHTATAWRAFYSNGSGVITELALGASGTVLTSGGASAAPTFGNVAYANVANPTVTSPSQITSNQNDYASFARGINRFTTNAARDITGMVAGSDGEVRVLCNTGTTAANTLTIKDESSSSTAANRFSVPWNGDCIIPAEGSVVVFYDGTSSRWRVV